jgi:hypothetical protein
VPFQLPLGFPYFWEYGASGSTPKIGAITPLGKPKGARLLKITSPWPKTGEALMRHASVRSFMDAEVKNLVVSMAMGISCVSLGSLTKNCALTSTNRLSVVQQFDELGR